jgi:hypothetical protein
VMWGAAEYHLISAWQQSPVGGLCHRKISEQG